MLISQCTEIKKLLEHDQDWYNFFVTENKGTVLENNFIQSSSWDGSSIESLTQMK